MFRPLTDACTRRDHLRHFLAFPRLVRSVLRAQRADEDTLGVAVRPEARRARMFPYLDRAACEGLDPELFYAESGAAILKAKSLCARCACREKCLEWAIRREEFGVWGGTTARERAAIRRERGLRLSPAGVA